MVEYDIPYVPHSEYTRQIHNSKARYRVVCCGRRFGKTKLATVEAFQMCMEVRIRENRPARGWVVAPTEKLFKELWRYAQDLLKNVIATNGIKNLIPKNINT